jgi:hypothetical protein
MQVQAVKDKTLTDGAMTKERKDHNEKVKEEAEALGLELAADKFIYTKDVVLRINYVIIKENCSRLILNIWQPTLLKAL